MTHPNPGKDTREQARALCNCIICRVEFEREPRDFICNKGKTIKAALSRARREGMEEAAGIAEREARMYEEDTAFRIRDAIRAAKEVDRG